MSGSGSEEERSFRARLLPAAYISATVASFLFAALNFVVGDAAWIVDLAGGFALLGVWSGRARVAPGRLALVFSLITTGIVGFAILPTGPLIEYYLWFFPLPPIAAVLGGRRLAIGMFALDAAIIVAFEVAAALGAFPHVEPSAPWFRTAILLGVFALMGSFAVAYDRERERSVARLAEARGRAERADAAKSRFLATMTHELRTPMNGILGMTEELLRHPVGPEQREMLETVDASGRSMLRLIDDLLDHSRIEAGRVHLEALSFAPRSLADQVVTLLGPRARARGLALTAVVEDAVPPALIGDAFRLRQVLLNLVGNALKFTERGEVAVRIGAAGAGRYRIEVRDTGIGIAPEALPTLFADFTQADVSTARRFGGTGLGLAISRGLVEAMGGALTVTSAVGEGSTFTAEIPLPTASQPPTPSHPEVAHLAPTAEQVAARRARTILIADDDTVNRRIASMFLERSGYTCRTVPDGRAALEVVRAETVHAVLLDCRMPRLDGPSTARAIRELGKPKGQVPIIALTATAEEEGPLCLASGMDAVLGKPTTMDELVAMVDRWSTGPRSSAVSGGF